MESAKLLEDLFDKKTLDILKLFLKKKDQEFCLKEIAKSTRVPLASSFRITNKLVMLELIERKRTKHLKTYKLIQNEKTRFLENVLEQKKTILDEFIEQIVNASGIRTIILYGKEEKDKANLLIIGDEVDNNIIREAIVNIKEKYSFSITHLVLTEMQYNQMAAMNLYSKRKEVLLQK